MIDFRNYSELIRATVADENERDANWKWSVKSIDKNKVRIRWGYLDYLEETQNCFIITLDCNEEAGNWIWACLPDGDHIECFMVAEKPNRNIGAEQTVESGIKDAIHEIAYYAHTRY